MVELHRGLLLWCMFVATQQFDLWRGNASAAKGYRALVCRDSKLLSYAQHGMRIGVKVGGLEGWRAGRPEGRRAGELESWRAGEVASCRSAELESCLAGLKVGELESWRAGELESWTAGELES